ncbi:MAG: hypothetical protein IT298_17475 [Chloroflexi bacterium]|nr:MAG: hypothetical protein UZ13_03022 [Chloroflexi bacterium OLB13]MBC6955102.1 hypothetical protein [Chloroflexota bacterium]MBV6437906.1 hypothetical protein [Anaerolineae bacterium]MDL1916950.1 hypothetical protein [Anaerolineae bacterium CFX4]OQY84620.1 MAG: hypothetical protein B6D42_04955 [Anaerolineae bacterium UTCFX5]
MEVHIGGIRVRIDGLSPEQGRQLGDRVGSLLSQRLTERAAPSRSLSVVQARVQASQTDSLDRVADQVVQAIINGVSG